MKKLLFTLFTSHAFLSFAQVPVIDPPFFQPDDEITISYDVTGTNLESLNEAWLWAWLPNLNNFNAPSNQNPANANASATAPAKLSKSTGGGKTTFSITLTPTNFFGKSVSEITAIGLIIKGNDWSDGQTSDHIVPISNGFDIALQSPTGNFGFYDSGESIPILAITSELADIEIFIDGGSVLSGSNITELTVDHTVIDDTDAHEIKVSATNGVNVKEVIYSYRITPTTVDEIMPAGLRDGINYGVDNVSASLVLTAPEKANVYIIGDFNNWAIDQTYLMKRDGDKFWQEVTGLIEGQEYRYQYLVDGEIRIADPYAEKISSPFDDPEIIARNTYPGLQAYPSDKTSCVNQPIYAIRLKTVW